MKTILHMLKFKLLTSPKASVHPTIPPDALAISPWNIRSEFRYIFMSLAPLYEWILDLL